MMTKASSALSVLYALSVMTHAPRRVVSIISSRMKPLNVSNSSDFTSGCTEFKSFSVYDTLMATMCHGLSADLLKG